MNQTEQKWKETQLEKWKHCEFIVIEVSFSASSGRIMHCKCIMNSNVLAYSEKDRTKVLHQYFRIHLPHLCPVSFITSKILGEYNKTLEVRR